MIFACRFDGTSQFVAKSKFEQDSGDPAPQLWRKSNFTAAESCSRTRSWGHCLGMCEYDTIARPYAALAPICHDSIDLDASLRPTDNPPPICFAIAP
jgi:hypothetical protein